MKRLPLILLLLGLLVGCPRTSEDEKRAFERNSTEVEGLKATYPGFEKPIDARLTEAKKIFEEGKKLTDEEAAKNKIAEANRKLTGGFVGVLQDIEKKINSLREKMPEIEGMATDEADRASAKTAVQEARKIIQEVKSKLEQGAENEAGATGLLKRLASDLSSAQKILDGVKKRLDEKKKKADADKKKVADDKKKKEEADRKAKQPWKCEYCGNSNAPDKMKCESCGAPRE